MLEGVYYTLRAHVRLISLGKLESQGLDVRVRDGGMVLGNRRGIVFVDIENVQNVHLTELRVISWGTAIAA